MPGNCRCETNPLFQPAQRQILSISNGNPALVITSVDHLYTPGTIVRFYVPQCDGMSEINGLTGEILSTPATITFFVNIDTTRFTPFALYGGADPHIVECATVVPIGENNAQLNAAVHNIYG